MSSYTSINKRATQLRIRYVNDAIINRRLVGIYTKIMRRDIIDAKTVVKETIEDFSCAETDSPHTSSKCINVLYRVLIDLAMKRYDAAHDKVRDLYYYIESPYMPQSTYSIDDIVDA